MVPSGKIAVTIITLLSVIKYLYIVLSAFWLITEYDFSGLKQNGWAEITYPCREYELILAVERYIFWTRNSASLQTEEICGSMVTQKEKQKQKS